MPEPETLKNSKKAPGSQTFLDGAGAGAGKTKRAGARAGKPFLEGAGAGQKRYRLPTLSGIQI